MVRKFDRDPRRDRVAIPEGTARSPKGPKGSALLYPLFRPRRRERNRQGLAMLPILSKNRFFCAHAAYQAALSSADSTNLLPTGWFPQKADSQYLREQIGCPERHCATSGAEEWNRAREQKVPALFRFTILSRTPERSNRSLRTPKRSARCGQL